MNREIFDRYVETQLAPALHRGDVFGPLTRTSGVRGLTPGQPVQPQEPTCGAEPPRCRRLVPLPAALQSRPEPDRDGLLQAEGSDPQAAARSYEDPCKAVGTVCELFTETECQNFLEAAG